MAIIGSLATLYAFTAALPIDSLIKQYNVNRKVADMEAKGYFKVTDHNYESTVYHVINDDWINKIYKLYPEPLIPFFKENAGALSSYQDALLKKAVCDAGLKPMGVPDMVLTGPYWSPFMKYNQSFAAAERVWLRENNRIEFDRLEKIEKDKEKEEQRLIEEKTKAEEKKERTFWWWFSLGFAAILITIGIIDPEVLKGLLLLIGIPTAIKFIFILLG